MSLKQKYLEIAFTSQAIACDVLNIRYLDDNDITICNYVKDQLPYVNIFLTNPGRRITLDQSIQMSLEQIKILGEDVHSKVCELIPQIPIRCSRHQRFFNTMITYQISQITGNVIATSGEICQYNAPSRIYDSDIIPLSHEHCHSLKDTNYEEYKNIYTLGETIPIFYELIAETPNDKIKRRILQIRMHYLYDNKKDFTFTSEIIESQLKENPDFKRSTYHYIQSRNGCYLNSFYYALILYNMYKENPIKIITMVSKVLNHQMTTLEMLIHLGIYSDIKGEIFERELNGIKKVLKKE